LFARSASLTLGSARKFPYISGLNQKGGQNQKLPFCSGEGGSWAQSAQSKSHLIEILRMLLLSNFFRLLPKAREQSKFLRIPRFLRQRRSGQRRPY